MGGYEIHGIVRRSSTFNRIHNDHLHKDEHSPGRNLHLHDGNVTEAARMGQLVHDIRSHEVYNLASQSHARFKWEDYVKFDSKFLHPTEVDELIGDASKAQAKLGWKAQVLPPGLAKIMVDADIARLEGANEACPSARVMVPAIDQFGGINVKVGNTSDHRVD